MSLTCTVHSIKCVGMYFSGTSVKFTMTQPHDAAMHASDTWSVLTLCSVQRWSERAVCDHQPVYGHMVCPYYTALDTRRQAQMVHVTSNLFKSNKFSVACIVPIYGCRESNFIGYCAQHGLKMRLTALLKECPPFLHTPYNSHTTGSSTVGCMKQWCDMCVMRPLQFCFLMD